MMTPATGGVKGLQGERVILNCLGSRASTLAGLGKTARGSEHSCSRVFGSFSVIGDLALVRAMHGARGCQRGDDGEAKVVTGWVPFRVLASRDGRSGGTAVNLMQ